MSDREEMRAFWNEKAKENPLWYVASNLEYSDPDEARFWASGEEEVATALRLAGLEGGTLAVDVGCGVGRLSRALATRFEAVRSFDVSTEMAELARRNLAGFPGVEVAVVEGDGTLPLEDAVAEFALSLQVLQHIPSRAVQLRYIREMGRVLAPGGRFVVQFRTLRAGDPAAGTLERVVRLGVEAARRARRKPPAPLDSPAWHGVRVGRWELRRAAETAGLRVTAFRWISKRGASMLAVGRKGL